MKGENQLDAVHQLMTGSMTQNTQSISVAYSISYANPSKQPLLGVYIYAYIYGDVLPCVYISSIYAYMLYTCLNIYFIYMQVICQLL